MTLSPQAGKISNGSRIKSTEVGTDSLLWFSVHHRQDALVQQTRVSVEPMVLGSGSSQDPGHRGKQCNGLRNGGGLAPRHATSWSGVRDALSFAEKCAQPSALGLRPPVGSEDCLYLNVYAPATGSGPFPVMVYIHGGAFEAGSSSSGTPDYFVEKGVVMVTTTYRLGALGLFSGVIMESGVATTPWALTEKPRERAYRMAEALGFQAHSDNHTDNDDARLVAFHRAANYSDIAGDSDIALSDFEKRCPGQIAFPPVVEPASDSAVITEPPVDIIRAGSYNQVPIILGVTSGEGIVGLFMSQLLTEAGQTDMKENFTALIGSQLPLPTEEQRTRAAEQLEKFYFGDEGFSMDQMQAVVDVIITHSLMAADTCHIVSNWLQSLSPV
ncbi:carboxylesterase 5A-like [Schistocerca serialis cubense]|uniref:carboxylesterase 5A-like n=1 Tax=Schistocerca serialis cubense TaxID=2023355 RepID=UPI00214F4211|nr:carboxylesterase 5A-like [Schistocerca serialis cubense]